MHRFLVEKFIPDGFGGCLKVKEPWLSKYHNSTNNITLYTCKSITNQFWHKKDLFFFFRLLITIDTSSLNNLSYIRFLVCMLFVIVREPEWLANILSRLVYLLHTWVLIHWQHRQGRVLFHNQTSRNQSHTCHKASWLVPFPAAKRITLRQC